MTGLALISPAFDNGEPIPRRYGYTEEDVNPPLSIDGVPEEAVSLLLLVEVDLLDAGEPINMSNVVIAGACSTTAPSSRRGTTTSHRFSASALWNTPRRESTCALSAGGFGTSADRRVVIQLV